MSLFFTDEMILSESEVDAGTTLEVSETYGNVDVVELSEGAFNEHSCTIISVEEDGETINMIQEADLMRVSDFYSLEIEEEEVAFNLIAESVGLKPEECYLLLESDQAYRKKVFFLKERIRQEKDAGKKARYQKKLEDMKHREKLRKLKFKMKKPSAKKPKGKKPAKKTA